MKASIADCLAKLVMEKFGKDAWTKSLEKAGMSKYTIFLPFHDIDDERMMQLIDSVCSVVNITKAQAFEAFGDYWVNNYACNIYRVYFTNATSSKDFLLNMDSIHEKITKNIDNAHPPRFDYRWKNNHTLIITYKSKRNLIDMLTGLVKGVGTYYKESIKVNKMGRDTVEITFHS